MATIHKVGQGDSLNGALHHAKPGDAIEIEPGTVFREQVEHRTEDVKVYVRGYQDGARAHLLGDKRLPEGPSAHKQLVTYGGVQETDSTYGALYRISAKVAELHGLNTDGSRGRNLMIAADDYKKDALDHIIISHMELSHSQRSAIVALNFRFLDASYIDCHDGGESFQRDRTRKIRHWEPMFQMAEGEFRLTRVKAKRGYSELLGTSRCKGEMYFCAESDGFMGSYINSIPYLRRYGCATIQEGSITRGGQVPAALTILDEGGHGQDANTENAWLFNCLFTGGKAVLAFMQSQEGKGHPLSNMHFRRCLFGFPFGAKGVAPLATFSPHVDYRSVSIDGSAFIAGADTPLLRGAFNKIRWGANAWSRKPPIDAQTPGSVYGWQPDYELPTWDNVDDWLDMVQDASPFVDELAQMSNEEIASMTPTGFGPMIDPYPEEDEELSPFDLDALRKEIRAEILEEIGAKYVTREGLQAAIRQWASSLN